jgi:hypothetical protein
MTTTNTYNPIFRAFRELTTPQAFRWYGTQAKATATLVSTIALRSYSTTQRLLNTSNPMAITAIAEPEQVMGKTEATEAQDLPVPDGWEAIEADDSTVDEPEQAIASTELQQAIALSEAETNAPEPDIGEAIADVADAEMSGADEALLDDEDPTERRYWSGEDGAEALAGEEA